MRVRVDDVICTYLLFWRQNKNVKFHLPYYFYFNTNSKRINNIKKYFDLKEDMEFFKKDDVIDGLKEFIEYIKSKNAEIEGEIDYEKVKEYVNITTNYLEAMKLKKERRKQDQEDEKTEVESEDKEESKEVERVSKKVTGKLIEDMKKTAKREKAVYVQFFKKSETENKKENEKPKEQVEEKKIEKTPSFSFFKNSWWIFLLAVAVGGLSLMFLFKKKPKKEDVKESEREPVFEESKGVGKQEYVEQEVEKEEQKKTSVHWRELVGGGK